MMPERIAELRALADAATPGPWRVRWFPVDTVTGEGGDYVVEAGDINGHAEELICYGDWDGDFIATARAAVPELLAEVERLTRDRDEAREELDLMGGEAHRVHEQLDRVRRMHRPAPVYMRADDCECPDRGEHDVTESDYGDLLCMASPTGDKHCSECSHYGDDEPTEWPCATIRAIEGGGEG